MTQQKCYTCKTWLDRDQFKSRRGKQCHSCASATHKRCKICEETKPIDDFLLMSYGYRHTYCRKCRVTLDREYSQRPDVREKRRLKDRQRYKTFSDDKKERMREYHTSWRKANSENIKDYDKRYKLENKTKLLILRSNQKAKGLGSTQKVTMADWGYIVSLFNDRCAASPDHLIDENNPLTVDHVIPLADSPTDNHSAWNIQPLCLRCNLVKSRRSIDFRTDEQVRRIKENCSERTVAS